MVLRFTPPPAGAMVSQQALNDSRFDRMVSNPILHGLDDYLENQRFNQEMDLKRARNKREQDAYNYDYGTPGSGSIPGMPAGYGQEPNYSPESGGAAYVPPDGMGMGGASVPGMSSSPGGAGWSGPSAPSTGSSGPGFGGSPDHISGWNAWQSSRRSGGSGNPYVDLGKQYGMGDLSGYSDIGAKRRGEISNLRDKESQANLRDAEAGFYQRRWSGPPGSGRAGAGGARDITSMSTRDLTTYRNSLGKDIEYAIPGTDEYNEKLDMMSNIDDELQNRVRLNRTPRGGAPADPGMDNTGAGGDAGTSGMEPSNREAMNFLQKNYPQLRNPQAADLVWAKRKMAKSRRPRGR